MRILLLSLLIISISLELNAQAKKILHQTFMVENYEQINIDLYEDDYEVVFWQGNTVMSEIQVILENGVKHLLDFHVDSLSRYEIIEEPDEQVIRLSSFDQNRMTIAIKYNGSDLYPNEIIMTKLYIPNVFIESEQNVYIRKDKKD